jgi:hypothetical protein
MARLRYQPATNPRGFQPIQLSSAGITRMQEENNRVIRNLESRRNAEISQRERNLQAMQQNQAAEATQRESNFQSEQQALQQQQAKSQAEERFAIQNRKDPNEELEKVVTGLIDFSQTIGKISAKRTQQMIADQTRLAQKAARDAFYSNPEAQVKYKNLESLRPEETAKLDGLTLEGLSSGEITPKEASKDFFANPGRNAVYDQAFKNEALELFYNSNTKKLLQSTAVIPELGFAPIEALQDSNKMGLVTQYSLETSLDKLGLSDKNPGYYQEGYEKVKGIQDALVNNASTKETSANFQKQAEQADFLRTNVSTLGASLQSDLVNPIISRENALKRFYTAFSAVDPRTGEPNFSIDDINNVFVPSFGKTFGEVFGGKGGNKPSQAYLQALRDRNQGIRQFRIDEQAEYTQNAKDFTRFVAIPQLMALTDKESDERDPLIFESFKALWPQKFPGVPYPQTLIQAEQVAIAKNIEKEENLFAVRLASTVPLTEQEIATIQNPATKAKYQAIFKEQQAKRFGTEFPKVLKSLKAKAISVAGFNPTVDGSINTTTTFLLIAMQNKAEEYALEAEKKGVKREFISEYSVNNLKVYLAKAQNDKTNLFYKDPDSPNNVPNFPNLFGNAEIKAQVKQNKESTKTLDKLLADRNFNAASVINMPYALGDQNDYERISDQIQKDPLNVEYTAEIMKISRITQRTKRPMTPREVYNASIGAVNRVSMREPVVANEVNPVEDAVYQLAPEVQKLYNDIPNRTFNRANRLGAEITNSQGGRNNLPVRASMTGQSTGLRGLANLVSSGEGSATSMFPSENYPEMLDMTIATELVDFQKSKLSDGRASAAVGAFQFLYPEKAAKLAGLPPDAKFTLENQEKMFIATIMNKPGRKAIGQYLQGNSDDIELAIDQLSQEFASIEYKNGRSYYEDGVNKASISRDQVRAALISAREELTN